MLSELTPKAIERLPEALRLKLKVQQQTRKESMDFARRVYADALVQAEIAPFKDPKQLSKMAAAARSVAVPDTAERLADLVEKTVAAR